MLFIDLVACVFGIQARLGYNAHLLLGGLSQVAPRRCESGGIGRRTGFRFQRREA